MNVSCHPSMSNYRIALKNYFLDIDLDLNVIFGGDGSLFMYKSDDLPNLLISSCTSYGHFAGIKFNEGATFNQNLERCIEAIEKYIVKPTQYHQEINSISVNINGETLIHRAIDEVIIDDGIHRLSKLNVNFNGEISTEYSTGLMIYTNQGWSGYAYQFNAIKVRENELGIVGMSPKRGRLERAKKKSKKLFNRIFRMNSNGYKLKTPIGIEILKRERTTNFKLTLDGIDVEPYSPTCTTRQTVCSQPIHLHQGDIINIEIGGPVTLVFPKPI